MDIILRRPGFAEYAACKSEGQACRQKEERRRQHGRIAL